MTAGTLITRSLRFHWRAHLGVVLGAAIGSAALIGALIVGDSVRETLRLRALARLGNAHYALHLTDRLFTRQLGNTFDQPAPGGEGTTMLLLAGTAASNDGAARANHVSVFGFSNYFAFANTAGNRTHAVDEEARRIAGLPADGVLLNQSLALRLGAKPGDTVLLRIQKPGALSRDAVITPQSDQSVALRLRVHGIVNAGEGGDLDLKASQLPPLNAFVRLDELSRAAGIPGKANLVLVGKMRAASGAGENTVDEMPARLGHALTRSWQPADLELAARSVADSHVELGTTRIFLDNAVVQAATQQPTRNTAGLPSAMRENLVPILTYLVNQFRAGTNSTPYSMVTAAGPPYTPAEMRDDEIIVNEWLAGDLQVGPGDSIALTYFVADQVSTLTERTNVFRVRSIAPLEGVHADRTLMPEFPGLAKAESTHDWDAGFPLVHKIRDKDEAYWKQHRGTPKAFVTLAAGQNLWSSRFGALTAIRWPVPDGMSSTQFVEAVTQKLVQHLDPAELGFRFEPVREHALQAASQSQDFGGLFIGFSFFLILAALILMGLLFAFGLQQRAAEIGTLLALGFQPKQVRRLFLLEAAALAFIGSLAGVVGGIAYARAMLHGLTTVWRGATNTSVLTFHVSSATVAIGLASGTVVAVLTIWLVLRRQARQPARELLAGNLERGDTSPHSRSATGRGAKKLRQAAALRRAFSAPVLAWSALALTVASVASAFLMGETSSPEHFFGAGSFALLAGLAAASWLLARMLRRSADHPPGSQSGGRDRPQSVTFVSLATRGAARRRTRSVATVALLACGVFLIVAIGAFRLDAEQDAWKRNSGTGGFALIGESTLPILKDLNTQEGRDAMGLDEKILQGVSFVPFRVRDGDDASCLNLNRAQQPRLFGVKPERLKDRFSLAAQADGLIEDRPWEALVSGASYLKTGRPLSPNQVAAIGDAASIQWALGKKIGDALRYQDERGNDFDVRLVGGLANSILQGSLIIDEAEFTKRFPSVSGYRMFLIDCPSNAVPEVAAELTRALQDFGFEVTPAAQRLAAFNAVQNTYLSTFQVLGGLGLMLGSAGLGIVVLRNVLERRSELALLLAVGFRRPRVQRLVLAEHAALLGLGLVIGAVSAILAVLPGVMSPRSDLPVTSLALTLAGVLVFGLVSTWLATRAAVRGNLLEGLRNE